MPCLLPPADGVSAKLNALHGYAANALAAAGCDCAMFVAKDYGGREGDFRREDAGKLYDLALHTLLNMAAKRERTLMGKMSENGNNEREYVRMTAEEREAEAALLSAAAESGENADADKNGGSAAQKKR